MHFVDFYMNEGENFKLKEGIIQKIEEKAEKEPKYNVNITTDKESYKIGDKLKFNVILQDKKGNKVKEKLKCAVRIYDKNNKVVGGISRERVLEFRNGIVSRIEHKILEGSLLGDYKIIAFILDKNKEVIQMQEDFFKVVGDGEEEEKTDEQPASSDATSADQTQQKDEAEVIQQPITPAVETPQSTEPEQQSAKPKEKKKKSKKEQKEETAAKLAEEQDKFQKRLNEIMAEADEDFSKTAEIAAALIDSYQKAGEIKKGEEETKEQKKQREEAVDYFKEVLKNALAEKGEKRVSGDDETDKNIYQIITEFLGQQIHASEDFDIATPELPLKTLLSFQEIFSHLLFEQSAKSAEIEVQKDNKKIMRSEKWYGKIKQGFIQSFTTGKQIREKTIKEIREILKNENRRNDLLKQAWQMTTKTEVVSASKKSPLKYEIVPSGKKENPAGQRVNQLFSEFVQQKPGSDKAEEKEKKMFEALQTFAKVEYERISKLLLPQPQEGESLGTETTDSNKQQKLFLEMAITELILKIQNQALYLQSITGNPDAVKNIKKLVSEEGGWLNLGFLKRWVRVLGGRMTGDVAAFHRPLGRYGGIALTNALARGGMGLAGKGAAVLAAKGVLFTASSAAITGAVCLGAGLAGGLAGGAYLGVKRHQAAQTARFELADLQNRIGLTETGEIETITLKEKKEVLQAIQYFADTLDNDMEEFTEEQREKFNDIFSNYKTILQYYEINEESSLGKDMIRDLIKKIKKDIRQSESRQAKREKEKKKERKFFTVDTIQQKLNDCQTAQNKFEDEIDNWHDEIKDNDAKSKEAEGIKKRLDTLAMNLAEIKYTLTNNLIDYTQGGLQIGDGAAGEVLKLEEDMITAEKIATAERMKITMLEQCQNLADYTARELAYFKMKEKKEDEEKKEAMFNYLPRTEEIETDDWISKDKQVKKERKKGAWKGGALGVGAAVGGRIGAGAVGLGAGELLEKMPVLPQAIGKFISKGLSVEQLKELGWLKGGLRLGGFDFWRGWKPSEAPAAETLQEVAVAKTPDISQNLESLSELNYGKAKVEVPGGKLFESSIKSGRVFKMEDRSGNDNEIFVPKRVKVKVFKGVDDTAVAQIIIKKSIGELKKGDWLELRSDLLGSRSEVISEGRLRGFTDDAINRIHKCLGITFIQRLPDKGVVINSVGDTAELPLYSHNIGFIGNKETVNPTLEIQHWEADKEHTKTRIEILPPQEGVSRKVNFIRLNNDGTKIDKTQEIEFAELKNHFDENGNFVTEEVSKEKVPSLPDFTTGTVEQQRNQWKEFLAQDIQSKLSQVQIPARSQIIQDVSLNKPQRVEKLFPTNERGIIMGGYYRKEFLSLEDEVYNKVQSLRQEYEKLWENYWNYFVKKEPQLDKQQWMFDQAGGYYEEGSFQPGTDHEGYDIFIKEGTEIKAYTSGVVVAIGEGWEESQKQWKTGTGLSPNAGNGVLIYNPHLKSYAYYAHLSEVGVKVGDIVEAGSSIGKVGHTGLNAKEKLPHLHFEYKTETEGKLVAQHLPPQIKERPILAQAAERQEPKVSTSAEIGESKFSAQWIRKEQSKIESNFNKIPDILEIKKPKSKTYLESVITEIKKQLEEVKNERNNYTTEQLAANDALKKFDDDLTDMYNSLYNRKAIYEEWLSKAPEVEPVVEEVIAPSSREATTSADLWQAKAAKGDTILSKAAEIYQVHSKNLGFGENLTLVQAERLAARHLVWQWISENQTGEAKDLYAKLSTGADLTNPAGINKALSKLTKTEFNDVLENKVYNLVRPGDTVEVNPKTGDIKAGDIEVKSPAGEIIKKHIEVKRSKIKATKPEEILPKTAQEKILPQDINKIEPTDIYPNSHLEENLTNQAINSRIDTGLQQEIAAAGGVDEFLAIPANQENFPAQRAFGWVREAIDTDGDTKEDYIVYTKPAPRDKTNTKFLLDLTPQEQKIAPDAEVVFSGHGENRKTDISKLFFGNEAVELKNIDLIAEKLGLMADKNYFKVGEIRYLESSPENKVLDFGLKGDINLSEDAQVSLVEFGSKHGPIADKEPIPALFIFNKEQKTGLFIFDPWKNGTPHFNKVSEVADLESARKQLFDLNEPLSEGKGQGVRNLKEQLQEAELLKVEEGEINSQADLPGQEAAKLPEQEEYFLPDRPEHQEDGKDESLTDAIAYYDLGAHQHIARNYQKAVLSLENVINFSNNLGNMEKYNQVASEAKFLLAVDYYNLYKKGENMIYVPSTDSLFSTKMKSLFYCEEFKKSADYVGENKQKYLSIISNIEKVLQLDEE